MFNIVSLKLDLFTWHQVELTKVSIESLQKLLVIDCFLIETSGDHITFSLGWKREKWKIFPLPSMIKIFTFHISLGKKFQLLYQKTYLLLMFPKTCQIIIIVHAIFILSSCFCLNVVNLCTSCLFLLSCYLVQAFAKLHKEQLWEYAI